MSPIQGRSLKMHVALRARRLCKHLPTSSPLDRAASAGQEWRRGTCPAQGQPTKTEPQLRLRVPKQFRLVAANVERLEGIVRSPGKLLKIQTLRLTPPEWPNQKLRGGARRSVLASPPGACQYLTTAHLVYRQLHCSM